MNKTGKLKKLGKAIISLHENTIHGNSKKGYEMLKECCAILTELKLNGVKNSITEKSTKILKEYYNEYKNELKRDTQKLVIRENKETEDEEKEKAKKAKELKSILKNSWKSVVDNAAYMKDAIMSGENDRVIFHADQIRKFLDNINNTISAEIDAEQM